MNERNIKAQASSDVDSWFVRHRAKLGGVLAGYVALLAALWWFGHGSEWINATTAYFVAANLIVLWWYADTTTLLLESSRDQVKISNAQYQEAVRASRIAHKPFVVVERIQQEDGYFHYYIRNIGAGLAVNVWLVEEQVDGRPKSQSLGSLAPNGSRILYGPLEGGLCNTDGVFPFALIAEGLVTRTAQWTATVNVRERLKGTEMRNQPLPLRQTEKPRRIEQLLLEEWDEIRNALRNSTGGM